MVTPDHLIGERYPAILSLAAEVKRPMSASDSAPAQSFPLLVGGELRLSAERHTFGFGADPPLPGSNSDEHPLNLGQPPTPSTLTSRPPSCCPPHIRQRAEPRLSDGDRREGVQEIPRRSSQAIKARHHQDVACPSAAMARPSCTQSLLAPLATSRNALSAPATIEWAT
jgi:hypothetical protein